MKFCYILLTLGYILAPTNAVFSFLSDGDLLSVLEHEKIRTEYLEHFITPNTDYGYLDIGPNRRMKRAARDWTKFDIPKNCQTSQLSFGKRVTKMEPLPPTEF